MATGSDYFLALAVPFVVGFTFNAASEARRTLSTLRPSAITPASPLAVLVGRGEGRTLLLGSPVAARDARLVQHWLGLVRRWTRGRLHVRQESCRR